MSDICAAKWCSFQAYRQVYPLVWEIPLDDVYFDGVKLPRSTLSPSSISLSALVDTVGVLLPFQLADTQRSLTTVDDWPRRATHSSADLWTSLRTSSLWSERILIAQSRTTCRSRLGACSSLLTRAISRTRLRSSRVLSTPTSSRDALRSSLQQTPRGMVDFYIVGA